MMPWTAQMERVPEPEHGGDKKEGVAVFSGPLLSFGY